MVIAMTQPAAAEPVRGVLVRLKEDHKETLGRLYFWRGLDNIFSCVTCEPPWRNNERIVSSIPAGQYLVRKRTNSRFDTHWHIQDVVGRTWILIHPGNFERQTQGCILVGHAFADLDLDGNQDVTQSRRTLDQMNAFLPDAWRLDIVSSPKA